MTHIYALVSGQLILYVGKTGNMKKREIQHRCKTNTSHSRYIPEYIDWTIRLLETVTDDQGTVKEQHYYDTLKPFYNNKRPGQTNQEYKKKYNQSEACKESQKKYNQSEVRKETQRKYQQSEIYKKYKKKYKQSETSKESSRKYYLKKKSEAPVDVI